MKTDLDIATSKRSACGCGRELSEIDRDAWRHVNDQLLSFRSTRKVADDAPQGFDGCRVVVGVSVQSRYRVVDSKCYESRGQPIDRGHQLHAVMREILRAPTIHRKEHRRAVRRPKCSTTMRPISLADLAMRRSPGIIASSSTNATSRVSVALFVVTSKGWSRLHDAGYARLSPSSTAGNTLTSLCLPSSRSSKSPAVKPRTGRRSLSRTDTSTRMIVVFASVDTQNRGGLNQSTQRIGNVPS